MSSLHRISITPVTGCTSRSPPLQTTAASPSARLPTKSQHAVISAHDKRNVIVCRAIAIRGKKDYTIRHEAAEVELKEKTASMRMADGGPDGSGGPPAPAAAALSDSRRLPGVGSSVRVTAIRSSLYGMAGPGENGCLADGVGVDGGGQPRSFYDATAATDCDIPLTSETKKALDAVTFIAAHLKNEDDYSEVCMRVSLELTALLQTLLLVERERGRGGTIAGPSVRTQPIWA